MDRGDSRAGIPPAEEWAHEATRRWLAERAAALARGAAPPAADPAVEAHLVRYAACRAERDELLELTRAAYAGQVAPAGDYPAPDLSFLPPAPWPAPGRPWLLDAVGDLVVEFWRLWRDRGRSPALAGAARGGLLFRYVREPEPIADLELAIDVFAEDGEPGLARVHVRVALPDGDPFDQAGTEVELRAGDLARAGATDASGGVDFARVPLAALATLRVTVRRGWPVPGR